MKADWEVKKLKDICEKDSSNVNIKDLVGLEGEYPIYGASGLIQNINFYHQEEEYIGIIKDGSGIGRTMLLPSKSSVIGTIQYILPKKGNSIHFINYALQSLDLSKYKQGAAIPHIYFRDYGETELVVPPLHEQKRIVEILDQKFAQIETLKTAAEKNLQNAKQLFQAELEHEFNNKYWNIVYLEEVSKQMVSGGDAPKGHFSKEKTEKYSVPVYANAVADNGLYGFTDKATINEPSITISARGSGTGFVSLRNDSFVPIVRLIVIIPNTELVKHEYLYYALRNINIEHNGTAIPQLTLPMIKKYSVPLPPLSEQKRIVEQLDSLSQKVRQLEEIYTKQIANCDELKQSFLKKAFEGEL